MVRRALILVPWLALMGGKAACAGSAEGAGSGSVAVTLRRAGAQLEISIANGLKEPVFLGGCNQYVLERRAGDGWQVARQKTCVWEGFGIPVEPGAVHAATEAREGLPPGTYRVKVGYSLGCKRQEPLSRADCRDHAEVTSPELTVE